MDLYCILLIHSSVGAQSGLFPLWGRCWGLLLRTFVCAFIYNKNEGFNFSWGYLGGELVCPVLTVVLVIRPAKPFFQRCCSILHFHQQYIQISRMSSASWYHVVSAVGGLMRFLKTHKWTQDEKSPLDSCILPPLGLKRPTPCSRPGAYASRPRIIHNSSLAAAEPGRAAALVCDVETPAVRASRYSPSQMLFCSNSDDNMLKNIELFDKLSLRFNGRVLFIKDVIGDEICCWSFYGQGRKIAEVCCTSIVYATEKKQTKVRAPRGRLRVASLRYILVPLPFLLEQNKLKEGQALKMLSLTHDCSL